PGIAIELDLFFIDTEFSRQNLCQSDGPGLSRMQLAIRIETASRRTGTRGVGDQGSVAIPQVDGYRTVIRADSRTHITVLATISVAVAVLATISVAVAVSISRGNSSVAEQTGFNDLGWSGTHIAHRNSA